MEIEELFESGTMLTDHTYYIDGSEIEPDIIIAISNKFHLQTKNLVQERGLDSKKSVKSSFLDAIRRSWVLL